MSCRLGPIPLDLPDAGLTLAAAQLGAGRNAIVLANMAPGSTCDWLPFARHLASWGFTVLCFDDPTGGRGDAPLTAAVELLRRRGAVHVSLIGASHGAKAAIVAAADPRLHVDAVMALSPEPQLEGVPVRPYAARLHHPILLIAAAADGFGAGPAARTLYAAAPVSTLRLLLLSGSVARHRPAPRAHRRQRRVGNTRLPRRVRR